MNSVNEAQQFGQLRARIESTFREPTIIVVTSAGRGDGKSATAYGLAASLAEADHRVLLVDANVYAPTLSRVQHRPILSSRYEVSQVSSYAAPVSGQLFKGVSFADERLEAGLSLEKIRVAEANIRNHFDFAIVDAAQLVRSNLAVLFSTIADGTMLTLRLGRLATPEDEQTIKQLTRIAANTLGALTVSPKLIKAFRERIAAAHLNVPVPARHTTSRHTVAPDSSREVIETSPRTTVVS